MKYLLALSLVFGMFLATNADAHVYYHGHHHGYYRDDSRSDRQNDPQYQNERRQPRCYENGYCQF